MATEAKKNEESVLNKEEKAFLMKALWKALQAPTWTKDDLIEFGKAIFSKLTLGKMSEKTFERILPFLSKITDSLGQQLSEQANAPAGLNGSGEGKKKVEEEEASGDGDVDDDDGEEGDGEGETEEVKP